MNLNKENTFTPEWEQKYPNVSKHFKKWIDEYKKSVRWTDMICDYRNSTKDIYYSMKFHDIPIELQYGVICKWLNSFKWSHILNCPVEFSAVHNSFIWWCQYIEATTFGKTEK